MSSFIQIENVDFMYNSGTVFEKRALKNINLNIERGEFIGIIGHTGSGKSTLIQHLNALIKPVSGKVLIDGEDISSNKTKLKDIRRKVGLVFQYPEHQLFEMTVMQDVAFGPENMGLSKDEVTKRVTDALNAVDISEEFYDKSPFELSGGQKRRVAIAGVLAMKPEVLVLDEPAAGLDPKGRDEILEKIRQMHENLNMTVILISHSMEDIARFVKRIIVINNGEIVMSGSPHEIFKNAHLLEGMGLAAPQATYLMDSLYKNVFNIKDGEVIYTVDAAVKIISERLKDK